MEHNMLSEGKTYFAGVALARHNPCTEHARRDDPIGGNTDGLIYALAAKPGSPYYLQDTLGMNIMVMVRTTFLPSFTWAITLERFSEINSINPILLPKKWSLTYKLDQSFANVTHTASNSRIQSKVRLYYLIFWATLPLYFHACVPGSYEPVSQKLLVSLFTDWEGSSKGDTQ